MTLPEPTAISAVVTSATGLALLGGHMIGDFPLQRDADAHAKAIPQTINSPAAYTRGAGWAAISRHVAIYLLSQAIFLALISLTTPLTVPGAVAALVVSGSTHAVIDRRWIVRAIVRAKGCTGWEQAEFWTGQALHWAALIVAALVAALITTAGAAAAVALAGAAFIAAGLAAERLRAAAVVFRPAPTDHL
jgi:hypothetical protein